jgi:hypothetical protein
MNDMITKINGLKESTEKADVKALCESTINAISSAIYNGVSTEARLEIERYSLQNLFEGLEKYPDDKLISEWLSNQRRIYSIKNLGVRKAVNTLIEKEAKSDVALAEVLESFREKLEGDVPEVLLYEAFISAMSGWDYLPAVHTELSAVGERTKKYKNDVDISKIIEVMKETRSNYLIPLIEDVVDNYLNDKTEQNKSFLKETLVKFSYDPFIRDIINIVALDATQLQLEYANAACSIEEKLFSPVFYLGENEVLFNVKGTYYVKKGNNVNKLKKDEVASLNEKFKSLCDLINLPSVEVSKKDIKVYVGEDNAVINDKETVVNGKVFLKDQLNEATTTAKWAGTEEFYGIVNVLRENFDEIAELDFVKRVYLLENENYAADVFKLRDNIFITTFDPINNKSTFYRNINPIQAEKVMMEHMRFDVSKTFEDILPNKEKILSEIESTKKEYSDYINELQDKVNKFSFDYTNNEVSNAVIDALTEELEEVRNDYKNYLNEVEQYVSVVENLNITVQDDQSGKSYTVVVPTGAMAAKGERGTGEIGAEGDKFGTEVGMASLPTSDTTGGAASAVTFDDDKSELISDEPSDEQDKVDLGADELEAYADKVDAEKDLEEPEAGGEGGETGGLGTTGEETPAETPVAGEAGDELNLGDTGSEETAELETPEEGTEEGPEGTEEKPERTEEEPEGTPEEKPEEKPEEAVGAPNRNLERTNFNKDMNPNDLEEPKKVKKVYLKRPKKTIK